MRRKHSINQPVNLKSQDLKQIINYLQDDLDIILSKEQLNQLSEKFINTIDTIDKVYWEVYAETDKNYPYYHKRQGIISKEEYQIIKSNNIKPDTYLDFGELALCTNLYCTFKDIKFTDDAEKINEFYRLEQENNQIMEHINYHIWKSTRDTTY